MNRKFKAKLWLSLLLLSPLSMHSQDASKVSFVNSGKMYVGNQATTGIYILGGVRMINGVLPVSIVQEGRTKLTGHFYQDSDGHVFKVDAAGYGTSNGGTISFFGNDFDKQITSTNISTFNRKENYVVFPNVAIDMDKNLIMPPRMAADMDKLEIGNSKKGKLYLKSANDKSANPGRIYDASLRFPKRTSGETDNVTKQSTSALSL